MFWTILIAVFLVLSLAIYAYLKVNVLLPSNVDTLIEEIKANPVTDPVLGINKLTDNKGVQINYEVIKTTQQEKGHIVLLSGHTQTMLAWPIHFYQPLLDGGYSVIRMDNRGLGLSSWMEDWTKENAYSLEDMATDMIAVLDDVGIKKAHLIGMSMGGMIAQTVSINFPERVASLCSIMSTGYYYNDPNLVSLPPKFYRDLVLVAILYGQKLENLEQKLKLHLAINRLLHGKGYPFNDSLVLRKAYVENTQRKGYNSKTEGQHTRAIYLSGSRYAELKSLQTPTLIIHGTADTLVKFEHGKKCAELIPNAKTLFIKGMGHHLSLTHTPLMIEHILQQLTELPQG